MDGYYRVIFMSVSLRKISVLIFIIFGLLIFFIFGGTNYFGKQLASLSGVITAWVTINPLEVEVSAPEEVEINKVFKVEARVKNKGGEKIEELEGKIFLPDELELVEKDEEQEIGTLPSYKEKTIFWPVKGTEIGNYFISVKVSGGLKEKPVSAEDSTMVKVVIKKSFPGRGGRFDFFQRFFDFLRERFRF